MMISQRTQEKQPPKQLSKIRLKCCASLYSVLLEKTKSSGRNDQLIEMTNKVENSVSKKANTSVSKGSTRGRSWEMCYKKMMREKILKLCPDKICDWFPIPPR